MPLPQRRARCRHTRSKPTPDSEYSPPASKHKSVRWDPELHEVLNVAPLRFEQIVGTEDVDYWMGFAEASVTEL